MQRDIAVRGSEKSALRTDIQALRGFAVLLVVLYHAGLTWLPAGFLGVDVFFVISGFLITGIIKKGLERGDFSFRTFYYRRAKRLLPAAYTAILLSVAASPFVLGEEGMTDLKQQVFGAVSFTINFILWQQSGYFDAEAGTKPLLHFWSLAVEEQYYILMPLLLFFLPSRSWLAVVSALLASSFAVALWWAMTAADAAFYLLPARLWELALGSLCALLPARYHGLHLFSYARLPALMALILVPVYPTGLPHPGVDAAVVCLATVLIILGHNRSPCERVAPVRALGLVGNISYSLYLVHWPVLVFANLAWMGDPPRSAIWVAVAASFALSVLIFLTIEEPFRRGFDNRRRMAVAGIATTTVVVAMSPLAMAALLSSEKDYEHLLRRNYGLDFACASRNGNFDPDIEACRSSPEPRLLVWGDSYAMALTPGLAKEFSGGVIQATSGACGPSIGVTPFNDGSSTYDRAFAANCMEFNDKVLEFAVSNPSLEIVVISSPFTMPVNPRNHMLVRLEGKAKAEKATPELAIQGISNLATALRGAGKRVAVVAPPPFGGFDIGACLERMDRGMVMFGEHSTCEVRFDTYANLRKRTIDLLHQIQSVAEVPVIWPSDFLCDENACKTSLEGVFLYRDSGHLSYSGSEYLVREASIAEQIQELAR